jgi:hypothetical protein
MNRRFVALLIVFVIALQGPRLAYANALTAKTMPAGCASHVVGHSGQEAPSCCPDTLTAALCCSVGMVFGGAPALHLARAPLAAHRLPPESGSVVFATEHPIPPLRPPIA